MSKVPVGTQWGNSERPVLATDEFNEFGDQIYMNGGKRCIVLKGSLYQAMQASSMHKQMRRDASEELLDALLALIEWCIETEQGFAYKANIMKPIAFEKARVAIAKAKGET
jgi:hypothetical protein